MVICHTGIIASIFCGSLTNHVGKLKWFNVDSRGKGYNHHKAVKA